MNRLYHQLTRFKAIARALYSRKQIVILDDVFSGLDQHTKKHVSNSVLGPGGLLRRWGCTVILVTHAGMVIHSAKFMADSKSQFTSHGQPYYISGQRRLRG